MPEKTSVTENIFFDLGVSAIFTALKAAIKNPQKKADLKAVLLKIRNKINEAYAGDPDFE